MQWQSGSFQFDSDPARLDMERVCAFLATTYWSNTRSREEICTAWRHSRVVFGVYDMDASARQVGCARVVTDTQTFGWLADVFIEPDYRSRGLGKFLVERVVAHPDCASLRLFVLGTRDAHGLYVKFGWAPPQYPERYMAKTINR